MLAGAPVAQTVPDRAGASLRFYPDDPLWHDHDMRNIPTPAVHPLSKSHEFVANTFGDTAKSKGPALNVNTLGEVPDSSWFTNRIGRFDMTVAELLRGPNQVDGPAAGVWELTGRPIAGITPKFTIRDARGDTYMLKFDPATNPELPSSVEMISTKLFHAIGYHVPEDFIVTFTEDRLRVAPPAPGERPRRHTTSRPWRGGCGALRDGRTARFARTPAAMCQAPSSATSSTPAGAPTTPTTCSRTNGAVSSAACASWRPGCSTTMRGPSTASIPIVEEGGRRYIRHYMQDFGSNLGSGTTSAQQPRGGYEYLIERDKIGKGMVGLGLYQRPWMGIEWPKDPSIGNIEAEVFDPATWKTEYPNPAFQQLDAADAFWAASIISRFTDPMIRAVVEEARLSNPAAAAYLAEIIIKRRDKTVRWGVTATNPVDRVTIEPGPAPALAFDNLAARLGLAAGELRYTVRWAPFDNRTATPLGERAPVDADRLRAPIPADIWGPPDPAGIRYAVAAISTLTPQFSHWVAPVVVTIRNRGGTLDVVGIDRPTAFPERSTGAPEGTR